MVVVRWIQRRRNLLTRRWERYLMGSAIVTKWSLMTRLKAALRESQPPSNMRLSTSNLQSALWEVLHGTDSAAVALFSAWTRRTNTSKVQENASWRKKFTTWSWSASRRWKNSKWYLNTPMPTQRRLSNKEFKENWQRSVATEINSQDWFRNVSHVRMAFAPPMLDLPNTTESNAERQTSNGRTMCATWCAGSHLSIDTTQNRNGVNRGPSSKQLTRRSTNRSKKRQTTARIFRRRNADNVSVASKMAFAIPTVAIH